MWGVGVSRGGSCEDLFDLRKFSQADGLVPLAVPRYVVPASSAQHLTIWVPRLFLRYRYPMVSWVLKGDHKEHPPIWDSF